MGGPEEDLRAATVRVRGFLIADAVSADAGGKAYLHGAGIAEINATAFPWTQPQLAVYALLEREEEAYGSDHSLSLRLVGPGEQALTELGANVRIDRSEDPELSERVNLAVTLNGIVFPEPGVYAFVVTFDNDEIDRVLVRVQQAGESAGS
jgi:hypothetical protein